MMASSPAPGAIRGGRQQSDPPFDPAQILNSALDGIIAIDLDGIVRFCNLSAADLLGVSCTELEAGRALGDLVPAPDGEGWAAIAAHVSEGSIYRVYETQIQRSGESRDVAIRISPAGDASGKPGVSVQLRDVTAEKALEREVLRKGQELERVNADLERSNRDLERFAHAASHDMQEPLRMVHSYVALLARRYEGQLDADADDFIGFAMDGAERMRLMINSLLDLSRVMRSPLVLAPVDLGQVVTDVLSDIAEQIAETDASVSVADLPVVQGDAPQLRRLLQNLISNSLKYRSDASPEVHIEASRGDDGWTVTVSDNGKGIAPESHEVVFEPFKRLHRQQGVPGSGLGLATARAIVERYGGRIWVVPAYEQGTAISFTIPERAA